MSKIYEPIGTDSADDLRPNSMIKLQYFSHFHDTHLAPRFLLSAETEVERERDGRTRIRRATTPLVVSLQYCLTPVIKLSSGI